MTRLLVAVVAALAIAPGTTVAAGPKVYRLAEGGGGPQVGVDTRGNAVAAWQSGDPKIGGQPYEETSAVFVSRRVAGHGFGRPRSISRLDLAVRAYALDVGASGDGAVVWHAERAGDRLYVNRQLPGVDFGPPIVIAGSRGASEPVAALDARGRLLVAWLRPSKRDRCGMVVMATSAPRRGPLRPPRRVSDSCAHAGYLRAALARGGNGALAWRSAGARSAVSRSTIVVSAFVGGHLRPARTASAVGNVAETLALAAGSRRTLAVWRDNGAAANRVLAATIDGRNVRTPVVVQSTRKTLLSDVQAAMSARDAAIVAWQRAPRGSSIWDASGTGEVAIRTTADGPFGAPEIVVDGIDTASDSGLTGVATDAAGRALAGYGAIVRRRAPAGRWGREIALRHPADYRDPDWPPSGDQISLAMSDAGEGVAVWDLEGADDSDYMRAAVIPTLR